MNIETQLRHAYKAATKGGRTAYSLARAAGLKPELLYRFARGGDLRLRSAAKLAAVLGLALVSADTDDGRPGFSGVIGQDEVAEAISIERHTWPK